MRTQPITLPTVAAFLVGAALVLPGCVDGFDASLAVEVEGLEADMPSWLQHPDADAWRSWQASLPLIVTGDASTALFLTEATGIPTWPEDVRRLMRATMVFGPLSAQDEEHCTHTPSYSWSDPPVTTMAIHDVFLSPYIHVFSASWHESERPQQHEVTTTISIIDGNQTLFRKSEVISDFSCQQTRSPDASTELSVS